MKAETGRSGEREFREKKHTGRELFEHQLNALQTPADSLGG